ncbi:uncharacterized protein LY89DRAFT_789480 [Mollisia scopiformis]|uniref:Uncharacterized protein n=1 Tax=Mollisia scopiformis TaxID=149040 RepID=A0A132B5X4_MOLSC|nr:uncharacterized protein LY89DRAFT_789480 [Mollisia scopiformis]KUJ07802.1 hypothetical protein LY89DRAFT_789480 [Mollisia scopiformis]
MADIITPSDLSSDDVDVIDIPWGKPSSYFSNLNASVSELSQFPRAQIASPTEKVSLRLLIIPCDHPPTSFAELLSVRSLRLAGASTLRDKHYLQVQRNTSGSACHLQAPARFLLQTPVDDDTFFSLAIKSNESKFSRFNGCFFCSGVEIPRFSTALKGEVIPLDWKDSDMPLAIIPLIILKHHVLMTTSKLESLMKEVGAIESRMSGADRLTLDFDDIILKLHLCNKNLVDLERRWRFESHLADTIRDFIKVTLLSRNWEIITTNSEKLKNDLAMQSRLDASEYDLNVLPRRITNQFTTIFNLIAQRDTKATIELATSSQKLAEAALRDSSSMKTIAAMTLIFLPGTFVCSFFSMTFFDWRASPETSVVTSLWVYFAVAVPFTIVVVLCWIAWTWKSRQEVGRGEKERATILPLFRKKALKTV